MSKFDSSDINQQVEDAINANSDASKKKKFEGAGADELCKVKNIEHVVKKLMPQGQAGKASKVMALAWGPSATDTRMGVCDQSGSLFVWDTVKKVRKYGCVYPFAQTLALSPDEENPCILAGGMRNATQLFVKVDGTAKMQEKKTWVAHDGYISSLHFLGPKKYISSSGDADIRVFDIEKSGGDSIQVLRGHSKDCQSIKFPRAVESKNVFITCSSDKTVKMWDLRANLCTHTFKSDSELNACTIFPTGDLVACGGEKDKTYVFDVRAYKMVGKYARNNMKTASCEFSKSGRELYVGHDDGALIVWDIFGSGENKAYASKTEAHTVKYGDGKVDVTQSRVQVLDVGPAGFLASGGFDGTVKIWGAPADA